METSSRSQARIKEEGWTWSYQLHPVKYDLAYTEIMYAQVHEFWRTEEHLYKWCWSVGEQQAVNV